MKVAIMQPYFFPYLGYWNLISSVEKFIVYDNIKYTKKGWINRNKAVLHGRETLFTLPLVSASDYTEIRDRQLSDTYDRKKFIQTIHMSYRHAPGYATFMEVAEQAIVDTSTNLFDYIYNSICVISTYLGQRTQILKSSDVDCDHRLRGEERVIAICRALNADCYINPPGGTNLYNPAKFDDASVTLRFLQPSCLQHSPNDRNAEDLYSILHQGFRYRQPDLKTLVHTGYTLC
jgi:hypothetical protein